MPNASALPTEDNLVDPANAPLDSRALLDVQDLSVRFGPITAVTSVSFSVAPGEVFGVVGESGAGKSATARAIIGLLPESATVTGSVKFRDQQLVGASSRRLRQIRGAQIGYVFQDALTALDPVRTVGSQLIEALRAHRKISKAKARDRARQLLAEVQIVNPERTLGAYPHQLSGGMRQRVVIAAALIGDPDLIIADELTSALDVTVQRKVLDLLLTVCAERRAGVILITHDLGVVAQTCDRVAVLYGGVVSEQADVFSLFASPKHPYTEALLRSMPRIGVDSPFRPIPGSAIQVVGRLDACPFAARCTYVTDECHLRLPEETKTEGRTFRCFHPIAPAVT